LAFFFQGAAKPGKTPADVDCRSLSQVLNANVVYVADPSLVCSPTLTTSWYAGHEGFPAQEILRGLLAQMQRELGATRPVYLGGSSGGFAALYFSWHVPGSVAVAANSQVSLQRHYQGPVGDYRNFCWPNLSKDAPLSDVICQDVARLYAKEVPNSVVYLQNSMDPFHVKNHMSLFLASIKRSNFVNVVAEARFWGKVGHGGSVPREVWVSWARTALDAESTSALGLLTAHQTAAPSPSPSPPPPDAPSEDVELARRMAALARAAH
jgi:hypothetical protein